MLLLLSAMAGSLEQPEESFLGRVYRADASLPEMNRSSLEAELTERGTSFSAAESDDHLRVKLSNMRTRLLNHRNQHSIHAQRVLYEVESQSTIEYLSENSLDTLLADDNAVFSEALSRKLLWQQQMQTYAGTAAGLFLWKFLPLGPIKLSSGYFTRSIASPIARFGALSICTGALMGLLAAAREYLRGLAGAPSFFGQKVTAITCREGIVEYMREVITAGGSDGTGSAAAAAAAASASDGGGAAPSGPGLILLRRKIAEPIFFLCSGSSIFEEVLFRGLLMHALHTKARLSPLLASALSSVAFGESRRADRSLALEALTVLLLAATGSCCWLPLLAAAAGRRCSLPLLVAAAGRRCSLPLLALLQKALKPAAASCSLPLQMLLSSNIFTPCCSYGTSFAPARCLSPRQRQGRAAQEHIRRVDVLRRDDLQRRIPGHGRRSDPARATPLCEQRDRLRRVGAEGGLQDAEGVCGV